jgi:acetoin utilization deacetylase AcuC-like enzyme/GNAT superfamily N-acetyltransferase
MAQQFDGVPDEDIKKLPELLVNPLKYKFRTILFIAEDAKNKVKGFAVLLHAPDLNFAYLDYIATAADAPGRGIGGALYERVRSESESLGVCGIFFECLPDDPVLCRDEKVLKQNAARLKFYETYGASPIINTKYEMPVKPDSDNPPYLVFDNLGRKFTPSREESRKIVRAILVRKYKDLCSDEYINEVVESFNDEHLVLRDFRYVKKISREKITVEKRVPVVINSSHSIHHVKDRGYVESPVRIKSITDKIMPTEMFYEMPARPYPMKHILEVHDADFVSYFKKVCENIGNSKSVYPYVFPIRNPERKPKELQVRAGYYCIDTFTPLNLNAYLAAKNAVDCTLTAADAVLSGARAAYSLVRPPGHHAEKKAFGGFCYFNNAAVAANYMLKYGKVAMLDVDYHHGNGQQDIFYKSSQVLTVSIHGHPNFAYPYFTGFAEEKGEGEGFGYNVNYPLPEKLDSSKYHETLHKALEKIKKFRPDFLVVCLGLDTGKGDPTGTWQLVADDFKKNGEMIKSLKLPVLVVQEGGYRHNSLGTNVKNFFIGLLS